MMAARFFRSDLPRHLHKDTHRTTLQQHCSGQHKG
jgi:hypothetical protein